jgi:hypothetical protein
MLTPKTAARMLRSSTKQRASMRELCEGALELLAQGGDRASPVLCTGETTHDGPHETGEAE